MSFGLEGNWRVALRVMFFVLFFENPSENLGLEVRLPVVAGRYWKLWKVFVTKVLGFVVWCSSPVSSLVEQLGSFCFSRTSLWCGLLAGFDCLYLLLAALKYALVIFFLVGSC